MSNAQLLHAENKCFVVAPAGYGKTHLIAEAVVSFGCACELILTHTHAGVDSIRKKILSFKPSKRNFYVETIDGFILRHVQSYPKISNWDGLIDDINWPNIRKCGITLFKKSFIKEIIKDTYTGLYVDEYQDCCDEQHLIILEISSILPTRILGDPLQGIFNFRDNKIIDWHNDVENNFKEVKILNKPWRWENAKNNELGNWLKEIRRKISNKEQIPLNNLPNCVKWIRSNNMGEDIKTCFSVLSKINKSESIAVIGKVDQPGSTHSVASRLKGIYGVIEPIESKDLRKFIEKFESTCPYKKAIAALDFGICCYSGINKTLLNNEYKALRNKAQPTRRKSLPINQPLTQLLIKNNLNALLVLIESFIAVDKSHLYRKELYFDMLKILRETISTGDSLKNAMIRTRENKRRLGRKMSKNTVGRTVLIKGLEFDHAIILSADYFDEKNLYVALTRASKTVTIISNRNVLLEKK